MIEHETTVEEESPLRGTENLTTVLLHLFAPIPSERDLAWWKNAANMAFAAAQNLAEENQRLRARIAELEAGHVVE